ncbi:hypothetical protein Dimus_025780 [Dionaea muscipula]
MVRRGRPPRNRGASNGVQKGQGVRAALSSSGEKKGESVRVVSEDVVGKGEREETLMEVEEAGFQVGRLPTDRALSPGLGVQISSTQDGEKVDLRGGQHGSGMPYLDAVQRIEKRDESQSDVVLGNRDTRRGFQLSHMERREEVIEFKEEDVVEERDYWANALIGKWKDGGGVRLGGGMPLGVPKTGGSQAGLPVDVGDDGGSCSLELGGMACLGGDDGVHVVDQQGDDGVSPVVLGDHDSRLLECAIAWGEGPLATGGCILDERVSLWLCFFSVLQVLGDLPCVGGVFAGAGYDWGLALVSVFALFD